MPLMKIGLKLYSSNINLTSDALRLYDSGWYDFIELYVLPGAGDHSLKKWEEIRCPFVIHAPHSFHGINLAQTDRWRTNLQNFNESRIFADKLHSNIIILHAGNNGSFDETMRQLTLLQESRIVLENKPRFGLLNEKCVGWSPEEFQTAISNNIIHGTALDFGHATCAAKSTGIDALQMIMKFMAFHPKIYHLSDGDASSGKDIHLNFGKGTFNIAEYISIIPQDSFVTIETPRNESKGLIDFMEDVTYLRAVLT